MAANTSLILESLSLYHFMCQHIVGTEETVRTKRLMIAIKDNLFSKKNVITLISSGSFGEGLEIKGSDYDAMLLFKTCIVHNYTENVKLDPAKLNLVMEMNDTKDGFTLLRCVNLPDKSFYKEMYTNNGQSLYLSSQLVKNNTLGLVDSLTKIHGPCVSDENATVDVALCFHNPNWIQTAENWLYRGNTSWPSSDIRSDIVDHGILFVPIGCKGSNNEALEWRISFSVAEKLLIQSFCHTQLLCYALMKILLKDLIESNINCKNLLCSYYIKTIILWVSEETEVNNWKPQNLIPCFMRCFRRLVYFVESSICPHYFIPTINMFENKIEGQSRQLLLGHLKSLFSFGWRGLLFSEHFKHFPIHSNFLASMTTTEIKQTQMMYLVNSETVYKFNPICGQTHGYRRCIRQLNITKSSFIKSIYLGYLSAISAYEQQFSAARPSHANTMMYCQYRKIQSYLLQDVNHDAVSGWLMLATLFFNLKQYSKSLYILNYALMKCTPEKLYFKIPLSQLQMNLFRSTTVQKLGILRIFKYIVMRPVEFNHRSTLIPEVLKFDGLDWNGCFIPPVAFAHFLCFLCHYHLNERQQCYKSIKDLERTIKENVFISFNEEKSQSYFQLAIALLCVGHIDLAEQIFFHCDDVRWRLCCEAFL